MTYVFTFDLAKLRWDTTSVQCTCVMCLLLAIAKQEMRMAKTLLELTVANVKRMHERQEAALGMWSHVHSGE